VITRSLRTCACSFPQTCARPSGSGPMHQVHCPRSRHPLIPHSAPNQTVPIGQAVCLDCAGGHQGRSRHNCLLAKHPAAAAGTTGRGPGGRLGRGRGKCHGHTHNNRCGDGCCLLLNACQELDGRMSLRARCADCHCVRGVRMGRHTAAGCYQAARIAITAARQAQVCIMCIGTSMCQPAARANAHRVHPREAQAFVRWQGSLATCSVCICSLA
jgi:hypothetical protein